MSDDYLPEFRQWFIFGEYPDGAVDVSDGELDVLVRVPRELAEQAIAARSRTVDLAREAAERRRVESERDKAARARFEEYAKIIFHRR